MPKFSRTSRERLESCDIRLQNIFNEVIKRWDCSIICGHRSEYDQNRAYKTGNSRLMFPKSKHNSSPSVAIDVAPYPIDWNDVIAFAHFAGYVIRVAEDQGIKLRWGGDWDGDKFNKDQSFNDLPHFEIIEWKNMDFNLDI